MELRMHSQTARIGLTINKPVLHMNTIPARIEMESEPGGLNISSQKSRVIIDQRQCFADEDHRNIEDFLHYWVDYARRQWMEGLAQTVSEGNKLAAIHKNYSIADMAAERMYEEKQFNIVAIPGQLPEIDVLVEPAQYEYTKTFTRIEARPGDINYNFQRGNVQVYIATKNSLTIDWVQDGQVDLTA